MINQGYIKIYRKFKDWEWYTNINVKTLFLHCLIRANHKSINYQGIKIDRGEFLTSIRTLSIETGLSERQVRTALDKLVLTNELTSKSNNKYRIIKVLKYNEYQDVDKQSGKQVTGKRQASDKPLTTNNNEENEKNDKKFKKTKAKKEYFSNCTINDLFYEWIAMRISIKKKPTERALTMAINKLNKHDDSIKQVMLEKSILNNYTDLYIPKDIKIKKVPKKDGRYGEH
jgi:hypothetical protein